MSGSRRGQLLIAMLLASTACDGPSTSDGGRMDGAPHPRTDGAQLDDAGNPPDLSCLNMIPLRTWTTDPSAVALLYRIETCAGETVVFDPGPSESVFDYYTLTENGSSLSTEAVPDVERSERQRAYVSLLLDFSDSTRPLEAELLTAAESFAEALIAASDRVWIGIHIFDGRPAPVAVQLPTRDLGELRAALSGLSGYSDPAADGGSTDLHGAIRAGVGDLARWQDLVIARNDGGIVTSGYLVAFTDGRDTAERVSVADAAAAVATARSATGAGSGSNVQTYAVAFEGSDFTAEARTNLVTVLGDPEERSLYEGTLAELEANFRALADRIAEQAQATHLLKYCSAARSGDREVVLGIQPSRGTARNTISFAFSAAGFAPGCSDFIRTICEGRECGGFNCGGCDDSRESCRADTGRCVDHCVDADACSGETITNPLGYEQRCGPAELGPGVMVCGAACVDTQSDDAHCGACGSACESLGGAGERCVDGACACPGGGAVCEGSCQPASYFANNDASCGACSNACTGGSRCIGTECVCDAGQTFCAGLCRDASYFETTSNCGTCGNACAVSGETCEGGTCACPAGQTACGTACRDLSSDRANCGACGTMCGVACITGGCAGVVQIAAGVDHTCALVSGGRVACWGSNDNGRLGDGGTWDSAVPVLVSSLSGATSIAVGNGHTCAMLGDGRVWCWGANSHGQLGDGTTTDRTTPVVVSSLTGAVAVSVGREHTCALLGDGTARCWGANLYGQLGDGTRMDRATPVEVASLTGATSITAGGFHTCALLSDGAARCWGSNESGCLGDGTITIRETPIAVSSLAGAVSISAGGAHTCALLGDRTARCWGRNSQGQLGDGTTTGRTTPVTVSSLTGATSIAVGGYHTCAVLDDGTARCWGYNVVGQVGNGITVRQRLPVAVSSLTNATSITAGEFHTCAVIGDGTARCWGENQFGKLGDGTNTDRLTPVVVGGP